MINDRNSPNELFTKAEDAYWNGLDRFAYEIENFAEDWDTPTNAFTSQLAKNIRPNQLLSNATAQAFKELVSAQLKDTANLCVEYVAVPLIEAGKFNFKFVQSGFIELPPLSADNACALILALDWAAAEKRQITISCTSFADFWVTPQ